MTDEPYYEVLAIGTWFYDGQVAREVELVARPARFAGDRWVEDDHGAFVLDDGAPIPQTLDGRIYYVDTTGGGEFLTPEEAMAWADAQPWGPVSWSTLETPRRLPLD